MVTDQMSNLKPYSSSMLAFGGLLLVAMGIYFKNI